MKTGNWRRWTAVLMTLLLILSGFVLTPDDYAGRLAGEAITVVSPAEGQEGTAGYESGEEEASLPAQPAADSSDPAADAEDEASSVQTDGDDAPAAEMAEETESGPDTPAADQAVEEASDGQTQEKAGTYRMRAAAAATAPVTLEDENYNLKYLIQSGYQIVCFEDAVINKHTMGGVLVGGNMSDNNEGIADSQYVTRPSFVRGYMTLAAWGGFNGRNEQKPVQVLYVGSSNTVTENKIRTTNGTALNGHEGYNKYGGRIVVNDDYIDWQKMKAAMTSLSGAMQSGAEARRYSSFPDTWTALTLDAGTTVTLTNCAEKYIQLDIKGSSKNFTVINIPESGTVYVPQVRTYNGKSLNSGSEDGQDMPVIFNIPNASRVVIPTGLTPSFGHVLAPDSDVTVDGGNYNGILVCKSLTTNGEGHLRNYHGDLPAPPTCSLRIWKTVNAKGVNSKNDVAMSPNLYFVVEGPNGFYQKISYSAFYDSYGGKEYELSGLEPGEYTVTEYNGDVPGYKHTTVYHPIPEYDIRTAPGTAVGDSTIEVQYFKDPNYVAKMWIDNRYTKTSYRFKKTGEDGKALPGAVLKLQKKNAQGEYEDVPGKSWTSAADSHTISDLADGSYLFVEVTPPDDYETAEPIPFEIRDGEMLVDGKVVQDNTITMVDQRKQYPTLIVKKVNALDENMTPELYRQVAFRITRTGPGGTESMMRSTAADGYWIPDERGMITLKELRPGTYHIYEERAPEGYMQMPDAVTVLVSDAGEITLQDGENIYVSLSAPESGGSSTDADYGENDKVLLIRNYPYIEMPETGRTGMLKCWLFGPLISLAGICLLRSGKRQKNRSSGGGSVT